MSERVTDQQYAILPGPDGVGQLRHLPGGIDQYLALRASIAAGGGSAGGGAVGVADRAPGAGADASAAALPAGASSLSGAERRAAEKELTALERRVEKLQQQAASARDALALLDQSDYGLLGAEMAKITALEEEALTLEERWLELSEQL